MTHPSFALQKAIFAALIADDGVAALIGDRIFDAAPRDAVFPYVGLGQASTLDWSTGTEDGAEHRVLLHVWSRGQGKAESLAIMAAIQPLLHDATLALDGHHLVNLRFEAGDAARDPDGITWHGVMRFRAVTEPG